MDERSEARPRRAGWPALAALALGCLLALALAELSARALGRSPAAQPPIVEYHPRLGFVPRPGYRSVPGASFAVEIDKDGLRSNGAARPSGRPILAVGDSYTFGDEVDDHQSWPAALERALGLPVLNGGVPAYGFEQTVLRAEELLATRPARGLVVSLIRDDVRRCQLSAFCGWRKPYFDISEGRPVLRQVPVPRSPLTWPAVERWSMRSALVAWARQAGLPADRAEHREGARVVRLLLERLGDLARRGTPVLLLIQGPLAGSRGPERFEAGPLAALAQLEEAAQAEGLPTLNLVAAAWAEARGKPALRPRWYLPGGHMSAAGNAWVAARLATRLRELGWDGASAGSP